MSIMSISRGSSTTAITMLLLALAPLAAHATAQYPEKLIYKGKTLHLFSEPLEARLASYWDEPAFGPPRRRPPQLRARSTACWRGYIGTWKIDQGQLWLVALHTDWEGRGKEIPIGEVFPGEKTPLRASWYSGILRVPLGKQLVYVHMGFHSVYVQDLLIAVRAGKVEGERKVDNRRQGSDRSGGFRARPSESELARTLMGAADGLQRCARRGKQRGRVEIQVQPDGSVSRIRLGGALPGSPPGRCLFGVLAALRYPPFFGPAVTTRHQLP
jgi:hypothetical protein